MRENQYWYARGYFDGRSVGVSDDELVDLLEGDEAKHSYNAGYDAGITDYCHFDIEPDNLDIEIDDISHIGE